LLLGDVAPPRRHPAGGRAVDDTDSLPRFFPTMRAGPFWWPSCLCYSVQSDVLLLSSKFFGKFSMSFLLYFHHARVEDNPKGRLSAIPRGNRLRRHHESHTVVCNNLFHAIMARGGGKSGVAGGERGTPRGQVKAGKSSPAHISSQHSRILSYCYVWRGYGRIGNPRSGGRHSKGEYLFWIYDY